MYAIRIRPERTIKVVLGVSPWPWGDVTAEVIFGDGSRGSVTASSVRALQKLLGGMGFALRVSGQFPAWHIY